MHRAADRSVVGDAHGSTNVEPKRVPAQGDEAVKVERRNEQYLDSFIPRSHARRGLLAGFYFMAPPSFRLALFSSVPSLPALSPSEKKLPAIRAFAGLRPSSKHIKTYSFVSGGAKCVGSLCPAISRAGDHGCIERDDTSLKMAAHAVEGEASGAIQPATGSSAARSFHPSFSAVVRPVRIRHQSIRNSRASPTTSLRRFPGLAPSLRQRSRHLRTRT